MSLSVVGGLLHLIINFDTGILSFKLIEDNTHNLWRLPKSISDRSGFGIRHVG